jgi:hypothetical protein
MDIKYFTELNNEFTAFELKMEYKRLAVENHPDKGGSVKTFQSIFAEYEYLTANIGTPLDFGGVDFNSDMIDNFDAFCASIDPEIFAKYLQLKALKASNENLSFELEICGIYIYITCKKEDKDYFKSMDMKWHKKHAKWFFKPNWYKSFNRKGWSMSEIRGTHGSVKEGKEKKKIAA